MPEPAEMLRELEMLDHEVERLRALLTHFRNRLLVYSPLANDMICEMDAALSFDPRPCRAFR